MLITDVRFVDVSICAHETELFAACLCEIGSYNATCYRIIRCSTRVKVHLDATLVESLFFHPTHDIRSSSPFISCFLLTVLSLLASPPTLFLHYLPWSKLKRSS